LGEGGTCELAGRGGSENNSGVGKKERGPVKMGWGGKKRSQGEEPYLIEKKSHQKTEGGEMQSVSQSQKEDKSKGRLHNYLHSKEKGGGLGQGKGGAPHSPPKTPGGERDVCRKKKKKT